ncbi:MAG: Uma2 family endonuclease [Gemmatimonadaceae bacterium]
MATASRPWTRKDLERLPDDGNRYEVLDGALLVTPLADARHQGTATDLTIRLGSYAANYGIGRVYSPGAIPHGTSELQPDLLIVLTAAIPASGKWENLPTPALVVEILSPSMRRRDLFLKREAYLRWGIPEYWIVDVDERHVTIVRAGHSDETVTDTLHWQPQPEVPALVIKLDELFPKSR